MKSILFFFILLALGFAAGYGAAKGKVIDLIFAKMAEAREVSRLVEFRPTLYPSENLPFCIVIFGRNNGAYLEKTLQSAFSQNYENFRILYIDDASDDGSFDLARDLIYSSPRVNQTQFVRNDKPIGLLGNLARVARGSADEEILVVLNGEDWLAHDWVLMRLNQYYADPDLWITYGQSRDYPTYQLGAAQPLLEKGKAIRAQPLSASHLKTFYAGLFKRINDSDFKYKGEYFEAAADLAFMIPMLEMAVNHSQCLSDILYISNREAIRGEDCEQLSFFEQHIRSLAPYTQLASLDFHPVDEGAE